MILRTAMLATAFAALTAPAFGAGCDKVTFSDVGWTDITATTAVTSTILQGTSIFDLFRSRVGGSAA